MKHKKLWIVVLVCVLVFISSSVAGIVVAANTVEWSKLSFSDLMDGKFGGLFESDALGRLFSGRKINRTFDQAYSIDLEGIDTIKITGVSEKLEVGQSESEQVDCRLYGEYHYVFNEMKYIYEKKGNQLHIHPVYPSFGFFNVNMVQEVLIPASFAGKVEIGIVSGACTVSSTADTKWSSLTFQGVSGSFDCDAAAIGQIRFNNVSGRVNLEGCTGRVDGETVSGSVTVSWQTFAGGELNSVSGDIRLQIPADASCELRFDSVSGDVSNQGLAFEMTNSSGKKSTYILNAGKNRLDVETVSGSLTTSPTP